MKEREELLSVIVPVYNVESYLGRCINSIIRQDYHNIEVLLIDDGSTDLSGELAETLAQTDSRILVFHKENGGLSDARNYGINKAKGKYITFIDSDDWISRDFLSTLYYNLIDNKADVSGCVFKRTSKYDESEQDDRKEKLEVWSSVEALRKLLRQESEFTTSACALLYKKECFNNIRYPKGKYFEDLGTTYKIISQANRIVHTNRCLYHYFMRADSIANTDFKPEYMDEYYFAEEIIHFITDYYPDLLIDAQSRLVGVCFHLYMMISKEKQTEYKKYRDILIHSIKRFRLKMIIFPRVPIKVKMGCAISFLGMHFTRRIYIFFRIKGFKNC